MKEKYLRLPKQWPQQVRQAVVQAFSLAFCAVTHSRGWAINSPLERVRLRSDLERAVNEIALLRDEIRIKDARMDKLPAPRRPHYSPTERMSILELRAARGWSAAQTARVFLIEPETIASWTRRVDQSGVQTLVQLPKYIVSDKGTQFWCQEFKDWCRNNCIRPRYGAVGRYGSIAIIERFIKSLKNECFRAFLIPMRRRELHQETNLYVSCYHRHRPHQGLGGIVPFQRDHQVSEPPRAANVQTTKIANNDLPPISLHVTFLEDRRHLPIVELRKAA